MLQETDHQVAPATSIHQEDEQLLCDLAGSSLRRLQSQPHIRAREEIEDCRPGARGKMVCCKEKISLVETDEFTALRHNSGKRRALAVEDVASVLVRGGNEQTLLFI